MRIFVEESNKSYYTTPATWLPSNPLLQFSSRADIVIENMIRAYLDEESNVRPRVVQSSGIGRLIQRRLPSLPSKEWLAGNILNYSSKVANIPRVVIGMSRSDYARACSTIDQQVIDEDTGEVLIGEDFQRYQILAEVLGMDGRKQEVLKRQVEHEKEHMKVAEEFGWYTSYGIKLTPTQWNLFVRTIPNVVYTDLERYCFDYIAIKKAPSWLSQSDTSQINYFSDLATSSITGRSMSPNHMLMLSPISTLEA